MARFPTLLPDLKARRSLWHDSLQWSPGRAILIGGDSLIVFQVQAATAPRCGPLAGRRPSLWNPGRRSVRFDSAQRTEWQCRHGLGGVKVTGTIPFLHPIGGSTIFHGQRLAWVSWPQVGHEESR